MQQFQPPRSLGQQMSIDQQWNRTLPGQGITGARRDRPYEPGQDMPTPVQVSTFHDDPRMQMQEQRPPPYQKPPPKEGLTTWVQAAQHTLLRVNGQRIRCVRCSCDAMSEPLELPCNETEVKNWRVQQAAYKDAYDYIHGDDPAQAGGGSVLEEQRKHIEELTSRLCAKEAELAQQAAELRRSEVLVSIQERMLREMGVNSDGTVTNGSPAPLERESTI